MRVICTRLPTAVNGTSLESSPWVTLHAEYIVVGLLAEPNGPVQLHIVADDGRSLAWFDSTDFMTVDGSLSGNWVASIRDRGALELAPAAWLAPGFWESYYDGDPATADAVESELQAIAAEASRDEIT